MAVSVGLENGQRHIGQIIKKNRLKKIVIDPVVISSSGKRMLTKNGIDALKQYLLPLASLVTPNIKEAELLSGIKIKNLSVSEKLFNFVNRELLSGTKIKKKYLLKIKSIMLVKMFDLKIYDNALRKDLNLAFNNLLSHGQFFFGPELEEFEQKVAKFIAKKY